MRDLYDALSRGDMPAVLGAMDPGIEWREAEGNPYEPGGKAWLGPDAVVQNLFIRLATEWDGFTVHLPFAFPPHFTVATLILFASSGGNAPTTPTSPPSFPAP
jgi:hypothetical protein